MLKRILDIEKYIKPNKVMILYGARQVGKTTLIKQYLQQKGGYLYKTGDDMVFSEDMAACDLHLLKKMIPENSLFVIDEAQRIENIGRALKLVVDAISNVSVIATGSSSFDLANSTGEPLTGRKTVCTLYPLSLQELAENGITVYELEKRIDDFMIYGLYPEVYLKTTHTDKIQTVTELAHSYLLKDILSFETVKNSKSLLDLLKLIAFQIGSEVSTTELAENLKVDHKTVSRYLDLLEKSFVLFRLGGFSRNLRKEVSKMNKYYFYDLGIRNALIANFNDFTTRNDIGALWENFVLMERIKNNAYLGKPVNYYFWRTYDRKEIDLIEECAGSLNGYEFKYSAKKAKTPAEWLNTYQNATHTIVDRHSVMDFLCATDAKTLGTTM